MPYKEFIPVGNPNVGEEEAKAAYDIIKAGWISSGPKVREFESAFAEAVDAKHAIAVNSGTAALHVALSSLGLREGDEVIVPSLSFISTANVVLYEKATPVLVECDPKTYNVSAQEIESKITEKTKAIIPVDMNGMPVDYDSILAVAQKHNIPVIADSAESFGALYKNKKVGSIAPIHTFSFFPNKNITTGEGGMITTNDDSLAEKMRKIMNQGQESRYVHTLLGYNYRMTNFQAVIGLEQLKKYSKIISDKKKIVEKYNQAFASCPNISIPEIPDYVSQHAWYTYTIQIPEKIRDSVAKKLLDENIETRFSFPPIHNQPFYKEKFGFSENDLPQTIKTFKGLLNLPIWYGLGDERQSFVIQKVKEFVEQEGNKKE
jgi:dTDP-4-amino-4,6-dideoxygalactose transaminase